MMCGRPPFLGKDDQETINMIKYSELKFEHPEFELFAERDFIYKNNVNTGYYLGK